MTNLVDKPSEGPSEDQPISPLLTRDSTRGPYRPIYHFQVFVSSMLHSFVCCGQMGLRFLVNFEKTLMEREVPHDDRHEQSDDSTGTLHSISFLFSIKPWFQHNSLKQAQTFVIQHRPDHRLRPPAYTIQGCLLSRD